MADQHSDPHRLVLVRHAKAASSSGGGDRSRPLNDKGRTDAARLGLWLGAKPPPDEIWSSSALRARETALALAAGLRNPPEPQWRDDLYDAGPGDLVELLREADEETGVLVVVGHNPTIEAVHAALTGDEAGFRAGAAAIVELSGAWSELDSGAGRLVEAWSP
jgi:phosphohistidine phosphatase